MRAAVIALLLIWARKADLSPRAQRMMEWLSLALMTVSAALFLLQMTTGSAALGVARCVTCALGLVWGGAMWMNFYCRLDPTRAFAYLVVSLALSCALSLIAGYLPLRMMAFVNLFVPAFAVTSYWLAMRTLDERGMSRDPQRAVSANASPLTSAAAPAGSNRETLVLLFVFCTFTFVLGITLGFPDGLSRTLGQIPRTIHQALLVVILIWLLWYVVARHHSFKFRAVWTFENVLLISSIVLLVEGDAPADTIATALLLSAESFFYTFSFFTSYDVGRRSNRSALFSLGALYGGSLACMGLGRIASTSMVATSGGFVLMLVIMSLLTVIELVASMSPGILPSEAALFADVAPGRDAQDLIRQSGMASQSSAAPAGQSLRGAHLSNAPITPSENAHIQSLDSTSRALTATPAIKAHASADDTGLSSSTPAASPASNASATSTAFSSSTASPVLISEEKAALLGAIEEKRIQGLRARCGLTDVEVNIARLICRGFTREGIARALGYSQNTIRNYTHNLYEKLGIHSKQELVALVMGSPTIQGANKSDA